MNGVEGASLVWIDAPEAGRAVAKLMLAEGRRRPAVLMATSFRSRELEAFAETMEAGGSEPCRWLEVGWSYEAGQRAGDTLFTQGERPDAVFAAADNPAIGLLDAARTRYGLRVPSDLSVVGFGNTAPAAWDANRLSSVRLPIGSLIQTAVATLLARLASADEPAPRIWLGCDIVERGTSLTRDL
ncbi:MAG: substrate-binding domain-containing protein [Azospirillaceae bacterium]|nr:substrate-binding domain-containing protein [Azospirillaceae bacterium]